MCVCVLSPTSVPYMRTKKTQSSQMRKPTKFFHSHTHTQGHACTNARTIALWYAHTTHPGGILCNCYFLAFSSSSPSLVVNVIPILYFVLFEKHQNYAILLRLSRRRRTNTHAHTQCAARLRHNNVICSWPARSPLEAGRTASHFAHKKLN